MFHEISAGTGFGRSVLKVLGEIGYSENGHLKKI
jgi:hypothetical protein